MEQIDENIKVVDPKAQEGRSSKIEVWQGVLQAFCLYHSKPAILAVSIFHGLWEALELNFLERPSYLVLQINVVSSYQR